MHKGIKKIGITMMSFLLIMTGFMINVGADNSEVYHTDDMSVVVSVDRIVKDNQVELNLSTNTSEDVMINEIKLKDESVQKNDYGYTAVVGENGNYKFVVEFTRTVLIEEENEASKTIERQESFEFTVEVKEIQIQEADEAIVSDAPTVTEESKEEATQNHVEVIKDITVTTDSNGNKTLSAIPNQDDLNLFISDNQYVSVENETGIISIKDKNVADVVTSRSLRAARATANNVTTGNKVIPAGTVITVTWKANRSYYWQLWGGISELFVNGERAYCLEPSVFDIVATSNASSTTLDTVNGVLVHPDGRLAFTPTIDQKRNIELISNYGYKYPGHQTARYEWATKKLIWNEMGWDVSGGMNVDAEISEIRNLIANHQVKPSWNNQIKLVKIGEIIDLSENGLDKFVINNNLTKGLEVVQFSANTLKVKVTSKNATLGLTKKGGAEQGTSYVYSDGNSQKVATLRIQDPAIALVDFEAKTGSLELAKKGTDGNFYAGVQFELSKDRNSILGTYTTGTNGKVTINEIDAGIYYVREKSVPGPLIIDTAWHEVNITSGETVQYTAVNNLAQGQIKVTKIAKETNTKIAGAVFDIKNASGSVVDTITTNEQGIATSKVLPLGNYTVVEKSVPAPYLLDTTPIQANIIYKDQVTPVVAVGVTQSNDVAKGRIEIIKKSNHGDVMQGVKFNILNASNVVVGTVITGADGKATSEILPLGTYKVVEIATINGFVLDTTPQTVTIEYKDQLTPVVFVSKNLTNQHQRSDITLTKVENGWDTLFPQYNGIKLADAVIELYAKTDIYEGSKLIYRAGELVGEEVTNSAGQVTIENLPIGDYYAKEKVSPVEYVLFQGQWDISIKYDGNNPTVAITKTGTVVTNQVIYGKVTLIKTNGGRELLSGAVFGVFTKDGQKITELTTDSNGIITTPNLRYGEYYFQELKAPIGHWLDDTKIPFTISEHESMQYLTAPNKLIEAKILVHKIDSETLEPLANVGFKILDSNNEVVTIKYQDGKNVIEKNEWITDEDGEFLLEAYLPYGKYTLIESIVPEGYNPIEPIEFTIDENQDYINLKVIGSVLDLGQIGNTKIYGDLLIKKISAETGLPLADTVFEIYNAQMELVDTITTDENGEASLNHLVYGQYHVFEVSVPFPHVINPDKVMQSFFVSEEGKVYELVYENMTTSINIYKIDKETGLPIPNTVFDLYNADKEFLETVTTDENGLARVEGYDFGTYFVEEMEVPAPFVINPENKLQELELTEENNHYEIKFENEKAVGRLEINKTDEKTIKGVGGATYTVYSANELTLDEFIANFEIIEDELGNIVEIKDLGNIDLTTITVGEITTDEFGYADMKNLALGRYFVMETASPYGYQLDANVYEVNFEYADQDTKVITGLLNVVEKRTKVYIQGVKTDSLTNAVIKSNDFELTLKDSEGNVIPVHEFKDGVHTWIVDALETYYLSETKAPLGYILSDEVIEVDASDAEKGILYTISYLNSPKPAITLPGTGVSNSSMIFGFVLVLVGFLLMLLKKNQGKEITHTQNGITVLIHEDNISEQVCSVKESTGIKRHLSQVKKRIRNIFKM